MKSKTMKKKNIEEDNATIDVYMCTRSSHTYARGADTEVRIMVLSKTEKKEVEASQIVVV